MLKRIFEVNSFFSNVLIPLIALALYCRTFAYFSSRFLTEGVNYYFASRLEKYIWFALAGAVLIFLTLLWQSPNGIRRSKGKLYAGDFFLLFLPLTPIVQYILKNQETLSVRGSLYIILFFLFFSSIYVLVIPTLLGTAVRSRTLMTVGLAFVFTVLSMSSLSAYFKWFEMGALRKQLMVLGGVFLFIWVLYNLEQRKVLYFFIIAIFLFNSSSLLLAQPKEDDSSSSGFEKNKLLTLVDGKMPASTPNIYLLIYDAYVPNETMLAYGIDNSAQEQYLVDQGFVLYPHTYSIGSASAATMSRVLNASSGFYGNRKRAVSGDGVVQKIVKDMGYETYGLFPTDYMFRDFGSSYDHSVPEKSVPPYMLMAKAILVGEFRFDIENVGFAPQAREQFVQSKRDIFTNIPENHVFMYTHSNLPSHSQNSGACLPNETELYHERLTQANSEMKQDLDLLVQNDPGAIIIVAGDHGPYLTKNCFELNGLYPASEITRLDIQDRYGTFLAIRWPTNNYATYDKITVLQDVFPAVFAYLYQDTSILASKVEPTRTSPDSISEVYVEDGIIHGGPNDGEPLYVSGK
ncbi:MAG: hypothetical protein QM730_19800 [Anaerolineales bacterium]